MRNLKKILALVLALVMSMSLLTVANAFTDDESINETYLEAAEVLAGLKVLQGRPDGSFDPKANVNRGEMAAIIYRMVTTDVTDKQTSIYAESSKLSDVPGTWSAGYVGFCNNSQLIMGYPDGTFQQNKTVTGHEALAMLLRAIGYGKNGEFVGKDWAINTAIYAKANGLLKNINESTLSQPATREMVAEMAFRTLLADKVDWSLGLNYQKNGETLAQGFELERLEGVVTGNEAADLESSRHMAAGKTRLVAADGTKYTLNVTTGLNDLGESRYAWVTGGKNVVASLKDTGNNDVYDNAGAEVTDLSDETALNLKSAEEFVNFNNDDVNRCEYHITYTTYDEDGDIIEIDVARDGSLDVLVDYDKDGEDETHMSNIEAVFDDKALGVWVGTKDTQDERDDKSDNMTWKKFKAEYIYQTTLANADTAAYGEWLKVIDNDGDGIAEYILKTESHLDEVTKVKTKDDKTTYNFYSLELGTGETIVPADIELEKGDKVLWSRIDGNIFMEKAETENATIKSISYKNITVTTTEDATYNQSGIYNETELTENILNIDEKVEYILYFDHFGHIRAYELAAGSQYSLLTEAYADNSNATKYIRNYFGTVEYKAGEADVDEIRVANFNKNYPDGDNYFFNKSGNMKPTNVLVPAFAGAKTNIASYVMGEDEMSIYDAKIQATDKDNELLFWDYNRTTGKYFQTNVETDDPVYARNYVKLDDTKAVAKGAKSYDVAPGYEHTNDYVSTNNDTEFYLVMANGIQYFVGPASMPKLNADWITAAYAVANNTADDAANEDYWVADVVVIELSNMETPYDSVGLVYYNGSVESNKVFNLDALDNEAAENPINFNINSRAWKQNQWKTLDFYGFWNTAEEDLRDLEPIADGQWNANGIYAATIDRINELGDYITLVGDMPQRELRNIIDVPVFKITTNGRVVSATELEDGIEADKHEDYKIFYVMNGDDVAYIILVEDTNEALNEKFNKNVPQALRNLWGRVLASQSPVLVTLYNGRTNTPTSGVPARAVTAPAPQQVPGTNDWTIDLDALNLTLTSNSFAGGLAYDDLHIDADCKGNYSRVTGLTQDGVKYAVIEDVTGEVNVYFPAVAARAAADTVLTINKINANITNVTGVVGTDGVLGTTAFNDIYAGSLVKVTYEVPHGETGMASFVGNSTLVSNRCVAVDPDANDTWEVAFYMAGNDTLKLDCTDASINNVIVTESTTAAVTADKTEQIGDILVNDTIVVTGPANTKVTVDSIYVGGVKVRNNQYTVTYPATSNAANIKFTDGITVAAGDDVVINTTTTAEVTVNVGTPAVASIVDVNGGVLVAGSTYKYTVLYGADLKLTLSATSEAPNGLKVTGATLTGNVAALDDVVANSTITVEKKDAAMPTFNVNVLFDKWTANLTGDATVAGGNEFGKVFAVEKLAPLNMTITTKYAAASVTISVNGGSPVSAIQVGSTNEWTFTLAGSSAAPAGDLQIAVTLSAAGEVAAAKAKVKAAYTIPNTTTIDATTESNVKTALEGLVTTDVTGTGATVSATVTTSPYPTNWETNPTQTLEYTITLTSSDTSESDTVTGVQVTVTDTDWATLATAKAKVEAKKAGFPATADTDVALQAAVETEVDHTTNGITVSVSGSAGAWVVTLTKNSKTVTINDVVVNVTP